MIAKEKTARVSLFLAMAFMAMSVAIKGVLVPQWRSDFNVNNQIISWVFTAEMIPFLIASFFGGKIIKKLEIKKTFILSILILSLSLLFVSFTSNYPMLLVGMMGVGVGSALIGLTVNLAVDLLKSKKPALLMTLVHFCFGAGAALIQFLGGYMLDLGYSWKVFYPGLAALGFMILLLALVSEYPVLLTVSSKKKKKVNVLLLIFLTMSLGLYLVGEIGISNWFVNFTVDAYHIDQAIGAGLLSLFFILFTTGRLFGGFILEKVSYLKVVAYAAFIAAILNFTMLSFGQTGLILVSISGIFQSLVYPALVLVVAKLARDDSQIMSIFITGGYSLYIIVNYLIGSLNDKIGVEAAYVVIPIALVLSGIFAIIAMKNQEEDCRGN
jgi:fucose permease